MKKFIVFWLLFCSHIFAMDNGLFQDKRLAGQMVPWEWVTRINSKAVKKTVYSNKNNFISDEMVVAQDTYHKRHYFCQVKNIMNRGYNVDVNGELTRFAKKNIAQIKNIQLPTKIVHLRLIPNLSTVHYEQRDDEAHDKFPVFCHKYYVSINLNDGSRIELPSDRYSGGTIKEHLTLKKVDAIVCDNLSIVSHNMYQDIDDGDIYTIGSSSITKLEHASPQQIKLLPGFWHKSRYFDEYSRLLMKAKEFAVEVLINSTPTLFSKINGIGDIYGNRATGDTHFNFSGGFIQKGTKRVKTVE